MGLSGELLDDEGIVYVGPVVFHSLAGLYRQPQFPLRSHRRIHRRPW
jgi:hypothetical protein